MMKSLVIVPTYNEADNIVPLIQKVHSVHPTLEILVVDDGSPDGTGKLVESLRQNGVGRLHILNRSGKQGLRAAYVAGFNWGIANGFDYLIEMDADFSHNPEILPKIISSLDQADAVVGSRYVDGGGTSNWNFFRKLISRSGSLYARSILGLKIRDLTGGFNGWRKKTLQSIDLESLQSDGYAFQIELKYRASCRGFRLVEIPIVFVERRAGASKMSGKIFLEAIHRVWAIRRFK
jgi:dolichol-phosphate mannosyltransferase